MTWANVDDKWPGNKKAIAAGPLARDLFINGLCYCNAHLTDGFIPEDALGQLSAGHRTPMIEVHRLIKVGLWERVTGPERGWRVHDYWDWNRSSDVIKAKRKADRERLQRWRERQAGNGVRNALHDQAGSAARMQRENSESAAREHRERVDGVTPPIQDADLGACNGVRNAVPLHSTPLNPPIPPLVGGALQSRSDFAAEMFRTDCPERGWRGHCVDAVWIAGHPGELYPVRFSDGEPKQCDLHRASAVATSS